MKKNMGKMDITIRLIVAIIISIAYFTGYIEGTLGMILLALGGIFLATSLINFCPLYRIFGMSTCKTK